MRKQLLALLLITPMSWQVMADELVDFGAVQTLQHVQCEWDPAIFEQNVKVYNIPKSDGKRTDYTIDQSGHDVRQIDVAVNQPDQPVILSLNAYEPTIWNIGWTEKTKILAIYATGYHHQVIAGIESSVPVIVSTYDNKYMCKGSQSLVSLGKIKDQELFKPSANGFVAIGQPAPNNTRYVTNAKNSPSSYQLPDEQLSGKAGLTYAINKGLIRPANQADIQAWKNAQNELLNALVDENGNKVAKEPISMNYWAGRTYVVLQAYKYPGGLYGAHSVTFIIPKGVPLPKGNPGHSTILDMNSMSCLSPVC